jgi:phosphoserine aminotransferase
MEMALWSLLGARGVDVLAWDSFGKEWVHDVVKELCLPDVRCFEAEFGRLPELGQVDSDRDVVFTWNGTTTGVRVPNADWVKDARAGLSICDATSAIFAMELPWPKLDVATFSWQKVLGGEAAHGVTILSPRAVARLEGYAPERPLPKLMRLTKKGKLIEEIFSGATINTPSLLCVEDYLDALDWAMSSGGLAGLIARCRRNYGVLAAWVDKTPWMDYLAVDPATRSETSVCLKIIDPWFTDKPLEQGAAFVKKLCGRLEEEEVAYDINAYRDSPPGLRIWCGSTVETGDIEALLPWLDWAYGELRASEGPQEIAK